MFMEMRVTGEPIVKTLDKLRRVVPPKEMFKCHGIEEGDKFGILNTSAGILLVPLRESCVSCGSYDDLVIRNHKPLCRRCIAEYSKEGRAHVANNIIAL